MCCIEHLILHLDVLNTFKRHLVDILQMATQIAPLCEALLTLGADEGTLARVLSEVITKIATFLENRSTPLKLTLEV